MKKGHRWIVRDGGEKDLRGILSLRKIVFGEMEKDKLDEKFWKWEFEEGPDGRAFIYVVEDGGKVIGHLADLPKQFSVYGEVVSGTFHLELMVHPDYRRRGVFYEMEKYSVRHVKSENRLFMTACAIRKESINGLKKVGWKTVSKLPVLVYPIRFSGIVKRYIHLQPVSLLFGGLARVFHLLLFGLKKGEETEKVEIEKVVGLDDQFDRFWERANSLSAVMGVRNKSFLKWRYFQHPTWSYTVYRGRKNQETTGYIVLRKVDLLKFNSSVIVDLLALDEGTLAALVEKGIQHSREEGADLLGFMVPKIHPYYKTLRGMGFLPSPKTFEFLVYPHSDREILVSPEKWYINWGDTDLI
jgi:GNAT superfamily N-acetyltransferase